MAFNSAHFHWICARNGRSASFEKPMANWKAINRKASLYIYDVKCNSYCMFSRFEATKKKSSKLTQNAAHGRMKSETQTTVHTKEKKMIKRLKLLEKRKKKKKKTVWFLAQEQISRQFYVVTIGTCDTCMPAQKNCVRLNCPLNQQLSQNKEANRRDSSNSIKRKLWNNRTIRQVYSWLGHVFRMTVRRFY